MPSSPGDLLTFARGELLRQIEGASERIWLASPYLSAPIASHIVKSVAKSPAVQRRLMTALVPGSVKVGVLDPKALLILREGGFEIASRRNLHAKVSVVDSNWGLIGSGNLTNAGLGSTERGNAELGVVLDRAQINEAAAIFARWWSDADPVSKRLIEKFDALERISKVPGEPADYGPPVDLPQTDELEQILAEDEATAHSRRYWLKSAYHDPSNPDWWHRSWISDSAPLPKYKKEDLIVIYLGARNGGPQLCSMALRHRDGLRCRPSGGAGSIARADLQERPQSSTRQLQHHPRGVRDACSCDVWLSECDCARPPGKQPTTSA